MRADSFFSADRNEVTLSSRRFFTQFVPKDDVSDLKKLLCAAGWLSSTRSYIRGEKSTTFRIRDDLWPAIPGEPVRWVP